MKGLDRLTCATALALLSLFAPACDGGDTGPNGVGRVGQVRLALTGDAAYFRLRIYAKVPATLDDHAVFDTGCLQQESHTYELSNIPVGENYTVAYQGFSEFGCDAAKAVSFGFRGGVSISQHEQPYYHLPVYPVGGVATLPEDINLSASVATSIDFCDDASDCAAGQVCYDVTKPEYWCVPSCTQDSDCSGIHVRATCDHVNGWCMLRSPFPLNLSEARAFGAAATLADGDVLFVGGMRQDGVGALLPTMFPLERFDAQTGLFAAATATGAPKIGFYFGFAQLGPERLVSVGGYTAGTLTWSDANGLALAAGTSDIAADVIVWDLAGGIAKSVALARGVASPTVVKLAADRFFVAGGLVVSGNGVEATRSTWLCTVSQGSPSCEPGPNLDNSRHAAAASCLDKECTRVLLVGGNPGGNLAEVVDLAAGKTTPLDTTGLGDKVFAPVLCGLDLVGGSSELLRSVPFTPSRLTVGEGTLEANPLAGAPATTYLAAVGGADPAFGASTPCFQAGGLDLAGDGSQQAATGRITSAGAGVMATLPASLARPRFGAVAARVGSGLLAGRVLFAGGVTLAGNGPVTVVRGAEILTP